MSLHKHSLTAPEGDWRCQPDCTHGDCCFGPLLRLANALRCFDPMEFMWMGRAAGDPTGRLGVYKHIDTRRSLIMDVDGHLYLKVQTVDDFGRHIEWCPTKDPRWTIDNVLFL